MEAIEKEAQAAFQSRALPGMVLTARDRTGKINYAKSIGTESLKEGAKPIELDSTFYLASMSKLVTAIAALQSVERGYFTLDEDVTRILPEFKGIQILKGFNEETGEPILVPAKNKLTLRHLLSHSSGLGYDHFYPPLVRYRQYQNHRADFHRPGKSDKNYFYPLLFEPGTSYQYGSGVDWAGIMTCRANNTNLEDYIQANICTPLNMTSTTFHLEQKPHVEDKLAGVTNRSGGLTEWGLAADPNGKVEDTEDVWFPKRTEDENGGAGLISSPADYQKLLDSLTFNNGRVLSPEMVKEMARPQLGPEARQALMDFRKVPEQAQFTAQGQAIDAEMDYGLGSIVNLEGTQEGRKKGTIGWSGLPNCMWWVDLEAGVSGTMFMALFPMGDQVANEFFNKFQRAVYDMLAK